MQAGIFQWFDLVSSDPEAAGAFYRALFGWVITPSEFEGFGPYTLLGVATPGADGEEASEVRFGGIKSLDPERGVPSHWLSYISVPDLEVAVAALPAHGAQALSPVVDAGEIGRFCVAADPAGAVFALFETALPKPDISGAGVIEWAELQTTRVEQCAAFYAAIVGWDRGTVMPLPTGAYHMMTLGEAPVAGLTGCPEGMPASAWTYYITVADVAATVARCTDLGGAVIMAATTIPNMVEFAVLRDPTGAVFGVAKSLS